MKQVARWRWRPALNLERLEGELLGVIGRSRRKARRRRGTCTRRFAFSARVERRSFDAPRRARNHRHRVDRPHRCVRGARR